MQSPPSRSAASSAERQLPRGATASAGRPPARTAGLKACTTLALFALSLSACGHADERRLLTQFFAASRLRDLTALSKLGTVVFEPLRDGIITDYDITAVTMSTKPDVKNVLISAQVRLPDGRTEVKAFDVAVEGGMVTKISERQILRPGSVQAACPEPCRRAP